MPRRHVRAACFSHMYGLRVQKIPRDAAAAWPRRYSPLPARAARPARRGGRLRALARGLSAGRAVQSPAAKRQGCRPLPPVHGLFPCLWLTCPSANFAPKREESAGAPGRAFQKHYSLRFAWLMLRSGRGRGRTCVAARASSEGFRAFSKGKCSADAKAATFDFPKKSKVLCSQQPPSAIAAVLVTRYD